VLPEERGRSDRERHSRECEGGIGETAGEVVGVTELEIEVMERQ